MEITPKILMMGTNFNSIFSLKHFTYQYSNRETHRRKIHLYSEVLVGTREWVNQKKSLRSAFKSSGLVPKIIIHDRHVY